MIKKTALSLILCVALVLMLSAAIYKGKKIDNTHFSATIWLKDSDVSYGVDVVFVGKAANIVFDEGQMLPHIPRNDRFVTFYLKEEIIKDPKKITLRQVNPPIITKDKNSDPDQWETAAIWYMRLNIEKT
jgi:hypothetical protein